MCPHHIVILQLRKSSLPQSYKAQQCFELSPQCSVQISSKGAELLECCRYFVACLVRHTWGVDVNFLWFASLQCVSTPGDFPSASLHRLCEDEEEKSALLVCMQLTGQKELFCLVPHALCLGSQV